MLACGRPGLGFLVATALAAGLSGISQANASGAGLIVVPIASSGSTLSYFKLSLARGHATRAGVIELRNSSSHRLTVVLDPVRGETIDTLGSTYASAQSRATGAAGWIHVGARRIALSPGATTQVPVTVAAPGAAHPGDYLSGVSVEALDQQAQNVKRKGVSIASVVRYAIGVEVSLPGPRNPAVSFTGARLRRDPSGLTFLLEARNQGNVILQGVSGSAVITRGNRTVARLPLGPGTFVSETAIAYPLLIPHERPSQGTVFRVRADLRYAGKVALLDTNVRFGHADAVVQQTYGGPSAGASAGLSAWEITLLGVLGAALLGAAMWLGLRKRALVRSPQRTLRAALSASYASGQPLSLLTVSGGSAPVGEMAKAVRSRLRHSDRLCMLTAESLLVVAADTDTDTAEALAADLSRHLERTAVGVGAAVEVHRAPTGASAHELLQHLRGAQGARVPTPAG